jgi:cellulose biosynthesis protein BcsQ
MAYFATFYSYKGGVGRTLALANVAWLLANHPSEPARILAIDFDLGAPGLFQVLKLSNPEKSPGVIDYVTDYLRNAAIPDVRGFIYKSAYDRIDILPAGRMDSDYQRRLEAIDWKALYEDAFGYELFEKLKSQITAITPEYDYVLIDSLTGFSDVGGICVNQLPDSVILLFRLNQQNLDGISRVYQKAIAGNGANVPKSVIPVITPSWPFLDEAASSWIGRAQQVFSGNQLLEISFDSSLSFGEKIISKEASKLPLTAKIVLDYKRLASQLRKNNPNDYWTIWNKIQRAPGTPLGDSAELYLTLLKHRPNTAEYWQALQPLYELRLFGHRKDSSEAIERLRALIDDEAERGNKFALLARSRLQPDKSSRPQVRRDLEKAIQIDPNFIEALEARANLELTEFHFDEAAEDFNKCLQILSDKDMESRRWNIQVLLAKTYLRMFDGRAALTVAVPSERNATSPELHTIRARALYFIGDYPAALPEARHAAKLNKSRSPVLLLPSQILAAMDQLKEASEELRLLSRGDAIDKDDLAEAYLAVDPKKAIDIMRNNQPREPLRTLLTSLAHIFLGKEMARKQPQRHTGGNSWSFFEVVALLRAKQRKGALNDKAIELAYGVLRKAADPKEFKFIERSRQSM